MGEEGEEDDEDMQDGDDMDASAAANSASAVEELMTRIEEVGGVDNVFPPLDGTSFYRTICQINHSCDPNVIVRYESRPDGGLFARLDAIRDIQPGEEFVQSYIDNTQGMYMSHQLFVCASFFIFKLLTFLLYLFNIISLSPASKSSCRVWFQVCLLPLCYRSLIILMYSHTQLSLVLDKFFQL